MAGAVVLVLVVACAVLVVALRASHRRAERERTLREFFASRDRGPQPPRPVAVPVPAPARGGPPAHGEDRAASRFRVEPAATLPTFRDVGGMDDLKRELDGTVGLLLREAASAEAYRIRWNGLLLHGPPGVGKTYFARAVAGQFGLGLLHVSTGDLVEGVAGESAANVRRLFEVAVANRPCLLLFDEFDSIAQRRDAGTHPEERRTVNQLLTSLEEHRHLRDLVVAATTNDLDHLDPAAVRAGRFDRHVRVGLPDGAARRAILEVQLVHRPACHALDLALLARRTEGMPAAGITQVVDAAALAAFRRAAEGGQEVRITMEHLLDALAARRGQDRPCVEEWDWDGLVLPPRVEAELRQLQALLADPDIAERLGVDPPSGVLLAGPPGTGKTTIGRVLAAQAGCSFYPVSAADVTSKWVGESERSIQRLFQRARAQRPSIVFIDEIDAIGARRGTLSDSASRQLNQLLVEMDGLGGSRGVMVVGATNRPELLDEALVRGGRLSRTITLPLPDEPARRAILAIATARMPTVAVDLDEIAARTAGCSGADLKALCQQAALHALLRTRPAASPASDQDRPGPAVAVLQSDFEQALADVPASVAVVEH